MPRKRKQAEMAAPPPETRRITPVDIQQKEFRVAFRGYGMGEVDAFLDEVTEEVARLYADNKRLREDAEFGRTNRLETSGAAEADAIVRQAREEAARIIAEATARASVVAASNPPSQPAQPAPGGSTAGPAGPSTEIMGIFLARERAFLQNMANLIQAHAEGVKQDVRRVREQPARSVPAGRPPAESAASQPVSESPPADEPVATDQAPAEQEAPEDRGAGLAEPQPSAQPASRDIVDLTQEAEPVSDRDQGVLSTVPERTAPSRNAGEGPGLASTSRRPGVEDDDTREDRSIRELFWGED